MSVSEASYSHSNPANDENSENLQEKEALGHTDSAENGSNARRLVTRK